jgi:hypothetical protein
MTIDEQLSEERAGDIQFTSEEALLLGRKALRAAFIGDLAPTPHADVLLMHAFRLRTLSTTLDY